MKRSTIALVLILLFACSKKQPEYQLVKPSAGDRVVLVEEFSGALCPNCPQGTAELESLKELYGDQLVILTIHAGDFAFQFSDSKYDFTTPGGNELIDLLGNPLGYPSGVVNRKREGAQDGYQQFASRWSSSIANSVSDSAIIGIEQEIRYNSDTRKLEVDVTVLPLEDINTSLRLTVALKEDEIIDPQADRAAAGGVVTEYVHKDVLRALLTPSEGDLLSGPITAFAGFTKTYQFDLPTEDGWWKAENCQVVSFVSREADAEGVGEILQATEEAIL